LVEISRNPHECVWVFGCCVSSLATTELMMSQTVSAGYIYTATKIPQVNSLVDNMDSQQFIVPGTDPLLHSDMSRITPSVAPDVPV